MEMQHFDFGGLLASFIQEYQKFERKLCKKYNFYPGQPPILIHIMNQEGLLLKELSELTKLGMPSLSVSIRNLEKAGFLYRNADPADSRASKIYITEKGQSSILAYHQEMEQFFSGLIEQLGSEQSLILAQIIEIFRNYIINYCIT